MREQAELLVGGLHWVIAVASSQGSCAFDMLEIRKAYGGCSAEDRGCGICIVRASGVKSA